MNSSKADLEKPRYKRGNILLRLLGPGLVTGAADDDPSGIATYSQAGAQFGYGLLWTVFLTTPFMIAIQLVSARIGRVTGKGLAANVMELAPRWLVLALVFLLVAANTANIADDIAAMGESLSLVIGAHDQCRLFPDGCGGSGDHDKPLPVFLAGLAGSRGNESGQGKPPASGAHQRRRPGALPHQNRYHRRHDLLERDRLFHHSDHRRRLECPRRHQH